MKYLATLQESEEGFSVWVPALPGCASQGATEEEASGEHRGCRSASTSKWNGSCRIRENGVEP